MTGVQTCALPIWRVRAERGPLAVAEFAHRQQRAVGVGDDHADEVVAFAEADAPDALGVAALLGKDDHVVGMVVADPDGSLLTVCELGYGKRTPFGANTPIVLADIDGDPEANGDLAEPADEVEAEEGDETLGGQKRYRLQRRGGKGTKDVKVTDKNGPVVGIAAVRDGDEVIVMTLQGMVTRSKVDEVRIVGRNTQGVRVMNLADGDRIVTFAKLAGETASEVAAKRE